jgi:hypothetical protein
MLKKVILSRKGGYEGTYYSNHLELTHLKSKYIEKELIKLFVPTINLPNQLICSILKELGITQAESQKQFIKKLRSDTGSAFLFAYAMLLPPIEADPGIILNTIYDCKSIVCLGRKDASKRRYVFEKWAELVKNNKQALEAYETAKITTAPSDITPRRVTGQKLTEFCRKELSKIPDKPGVNRIKRILELKNRGAEIIDLSTACNIKLAKVYFKTLARTNSKEQIEKLLLLVEDYKHYSFYQETLIKLAPFINSVDELNERLDECYTDDAAVAYTTRWLQLTNSATEANELYKIIAETGNIAAIKVAIDTLNIRCINEINAIEEPTEEELTKYYYLAPYKSEAQRLAFTWICYLHQ